jgi:hypothetical protein
MIYSTKKKNNIYKMAEIKLLQIDLRLNPNAFNPNAPELHIPSGSNFTYQINKNFEGFGYDLNPSLVNKSFISPDATQVDNIFTLKNGIVQDLIGSFNDDVETIEPFLWREENVNLIAVGGKFTEYTKNGVTTACNLFIILNADGTVFQSVDYSDFIRDGVSVNIIKYHSINDSLIIGGDFEGVDIYDLNNLFELDLLNEAVSGNMINFATEGSVNNTVFAIDIIQNNGVIIFGGLFTNVIGVTANKLFVVNSDFQLQNNSFFTSLRSKINVSPTDFIGAIHVKQEGELQVLVGGQFVVNNNLGNNNRNLVAFNNKGIVLPNFKEVQGIVFDIVEKDSSYYITGAVFKYGEIDTNGFFKIDFFGEIDTSIIFDYDIEAIIDIEFVNDSLYLFFISNSLGYNFGKYNFNTGEIEDILQVFDRVNVIKYLPYSNNILVGGDIREFNKVIADLGRNDVLLNNASLSITRDNLFNNLVEQNSIDTDLTFRYIKIGTDTIRIFKIVENNDDIYFITNIKQIPNKLSITIASNDAGLEGRLINIPLRKDFFIKSPVASNWSSAKFKFGLYTPNVSIGGDITEINKQKINDSQINQFINISPLVDSSTLESNISYYNNLNYGTTSPVINPANVGNFISFSANISLNDIVLEEKNDIGFILDAYNDFQSILIKGKRRNFKAKDKITIPFITSRVSRIDILDGVNTISLINTNFENIDPNNSNIYISYLCIDYNEYFFKDKTTITFFDNNGLFDTITLFKATPSCLFESFKVIFKNSFGVLETTYMTGRSIDSVSTDSSSYNRDIKDINGNIQEPLRHRNKTYNKVGEREWECNTGLVDAYMNDCYEDLFMSEEVWLEYDNKLHAVSLEETNFNKEDNLQTDMINYRFRFKEDTKINE